MHPFGSFLGTRSRLQGAIWDHEAESPAMYRRPDAEPLPPEPDRPGRMERVKRGVRGPAGLTARPRLIRLADADVSARGRRPSGAELRHARSSQHDRRRGRMPAGSGYERQGMTDQPQLRGDAARVAVGRRVRRCVRRPEPGRGLRSAGRVWNDLLDRIEVSSAPRGRLQRRREPPVARETAPGGRRLRHRRATARPWRSLRIRDPDRQRAPWHRPPPAVPGRDVRPDRSRWAS